MAEARVPRSGGHVSTWHGESFPCPSQWKEVGGGKWSFDGLQLAKAWDSGKLGSTMLVLFERAAYGMRLCSFRDDVRALVREGVLTKEVPGPGRS